MIVHDYLCRIDRSLSILTKLKDATLLQNSFGINSFAVIIE